MKQEQWQQKNKQKPIELYQPEDGINKPSHLIKQVYDDSLTTNQKQLYNLLLRTLLDPSIKKDEPNKIKLKTKDIEKVLGMKKYKELKDDLRKLMKTIIKISDNEFEAESVLISSYKMPKDLLNQDIEGNLTVNF